MTPAARAPSGPAGTTPDDPVTAIEPETPATPETRAAATADATAVRGTQRLVAEPPLESSFVAAATGEPLPGLPDPVCAGATTADALTAFFDGNAPIAGADYQRAYSLPSGRVLWLFQDAFLPTPSGPQLVHNVGLLQSGACFQILDSGSRDAPGSYLLSELTTRHHRWFWPLGGGIGADGDLHVFVAEMVEHGDRYLGHTVPTATWLVTIDADDLTVLDQRPAPDSSAALYGWSVVSAGDETFLYAHCYRQFGFDPLGFAPEVLAHDLRCTSDITVARIPRGRYDETPSYWDGAGWVADARAAVPVIPTGGRNVNPSQVALSDGEFVAVTKVGDWWGTTIVLDRAPAAEGPWETYATVEVEPECARCNTYFASIIPFGADPGSFLVGLSGNTWAGDGWATGHYRPSFLRVPMPAR